MEGIIINERTEQAEDRRRRYRCLPGLTAIALLFPLAPVILLSACASREEVARVRSPDGAIDAILVEVNGGISTDFAYSVRLDGRGWLAGGRDVASFYAAHRSSCAYGVNLRWVAPNRLLIEYLDAEEAEVQPKRVGGRQVAVELKPGITDARAPCGGMGYNLRGRP